MRIGDIVKTDGEAYGVIVQDIKGLPKPAWEIEFYTHSNVNAKGFALRKNGYYEESLTLVEELV